jgi:hypothetical protein
VVWAALGCLAVDEVQTPNADIDRASAEPMATGDGEAPPSSASCGEQGWVTVRVSGRDERAAWAAPALAAGCGAGPHRLTAQAPRLGSSLELSLSSRTGRLVEATYSTTGTGADGEPWGDYVAPIDVENLSLLAASSPAEQPFEFAGTIWGPFGPVSIAMSGCARVVQSPC